MCRREVKREFQAGISKHIARKRNISAKISFGIPFDFSEKYAMIELSKVSAAQHGGGP